MSAPFVFTEEAENQLLDIIDHISAESEDAAVRVYAATDHSCKYRWLRAPATKAIWRCQSCDGLAAANIAAKFPSHRLSGRHREE